MRRLAVIGLVLLCIGLLCQPAAKADSTLTSVLFNVNGTTQTNFAGFNTGGFNQTTGNGTLTFTFNPGAAGSYNFTSFFDLYLTPAFYNEFGSSTGVPAAGQSWEIGDSFASSIYTDAIAGVLTNTNMLPGHADNFLLNCTAGATCNGDAALAMGFDFTLTAGQEAIITLTLSTTQPGSGFYLTQTHPIDPGTNSILNLYFTGSEVAQSAVVGAPEPSSLLLLGLALAALCLAMGRKSVSQLI